MHLRQHLSKTSPHSYTTQRHPLTHPHLKDISSLIHFSKTSLYAILYGTMREMHTRHYEKYEIRVVYAVFPIHCISCMCRVCCMREVTQPLGNRGWEIHHTRHYERGGCMLYFWSCMVYVYAVFLDMYIYISIYIYIQIYTHKYI